MAIIHQEKCFERNKSPWEGIGWAIMPMAWVGWGTLGGEFETIIFYGHLYLRILYVDRTFPNQQLYVVEADNWRWPAWWALLQLWRFLCQLERNLRLTAAVWGLLKCPPACIPQWSDFVLWRWLKDGP